MAGRKKTDDGGSLNEVMDYVSKTYKDGSLRLLSDAPDIEVETIPTGILPLDLALGTRLGFPRGRIIEIYGPSGSGKTTVALSTVAQAQSQDETCLFLDTEHAMDPTYMRALGVREDSLYVSQPNSGEEAFDTILKAAETGSVGLIVLDSLANTPPQAELEGDLGDANIGRHAKLVTQFLRKATSVVDRTNTTLLLINQLRAAIGDPYKNEYTPGGRAVEFYSSVRLDVRRIQTLKNSDGDATANRTRVRVVKNKVGIPAKTCEFDIEYGKGAVKEGWLLDMAVECGIVKKSGAWFTYEGEQLGQGRSKAMTFLSTATVAHEIETRLMDVING